MIDILDRLKASSKVNGAYPRDIRDAILEIENLRDFKETIMIHLNQDKDGTYFLTEESYEEVTMKYLCS